jgi:hypothetical protein
MRQGPGLSLAALAAFAVFAVVVALTGCTGNGATATSGLTLPVPQDPDTLLPSENVTDPPIDTNPVSPNAMFHGDVCTALTPSDVTRVFGARLVDATPLSLDTCRFLIGNGAKQIDVRVGLSSIEEFTAPQQRDIRDVGPTVPTSPVTESTTDSDIPNTAQPPTPVITDTPSGTDATTTEVVAGPAPEVEELNGVGLAVRGLQQGRFYELYVKVDRGFFTVLAPTKADAIALATLIVPHTAA